MDTKKPMPPAKYIAVFSDDKTVEFEGKWGLTAAWRITGFELGGLPFDITGFSASPDLAREDAANAGAGKYVNATEVIDVVATSNV